MFKFKAMKDWFMQPILEKQNTPVYNAYIPHESPDKSLLIGVISERLFLRVLKEQPDWLTDVSDNGKWKEGHSVYEVKEDFILNCFGQFILNIPEGAIIIKSTDKVHKDYWKY